MLDSHNLHARSSVDARALPLRFQQQLEIMRDAGTNGQRTQSLLPLKVIGAGIALYVLLGLVSWIKAAGAFGGALLFCSGLLIGLVTLPVALVAGFVLITKSGPLELLQTTKSQEATDPNLLPPEVPGGLTDQQQQYDDVVKEMLQVSGMVGPPIKCFDKGVFHGWVWTIPSSQYDKKEAIENWPPATDGPKKIATRWWGSLRGRILYLAKTSSLQETYQVPVLEIDILDCRVEIVTDGLKSKSKWWRKCPLQISHASKNVLHSERSVAIFAEGSAAKEQWYTALKEASGQASSIQRVKESYQQFSDSIRAEAPDLYPQAADGGAGGSIAEALAAGKRSGSPTKGASTQPRAWGRLFSKRRKPSSQEPVAKTPNARSRTTSPSRKPKSSASGYLSPMELDSAWMGKGSVPKHIAIPAAEQGKSPDIAEGGASNESKVSISVEDVERSSQSLPAGDLSEKGDRLGKPSKSVHFPVLSDEAKEETAGAVPETPVEKLEGSLEQQDDGTADCSSSSNPGHLLPIEAAINMLLVRGAFDVLRSPAVNAALKAHIHKKLNELRFPSWLHGIEVHDIETGTSVPTIHNLKAMPFTGSSIWPQVVFDFEYEGEITVVIETKLDVRDGMAWSQLDKAIGRLEGSNAGDQREDQLNQDSDSETEIESPDGRSPEASSSDVGKKTPPKMGLLANILPLRQRFAQGIRQVAEVAADHVSRMPLKLRLDIRSLKGPMYAWLPPPPGDRLWFSFVHPPVLIAAATPLVGGRLLKYSYQAGRVSQWVASKLQSSIAKNMVFPSCSDIPIKVLIGVDHPELAAIPAAFPTAATRKRAKDVDPKKQLQNLEEGANEGPVLRGEVERAASLENQAIIDTSAIASTAEHEKALPSQSTASSTSTSGLVGKNLTTKTKPVVPTSSSPKKTGFWGRKKSAKKLNQAEAAPRNKEAVSTGKTESPGSGGTAREAGASKAQLPLGLPKGAATAGGSHGDALEHELAPIAPRTASATEPSSNSSMPAEHRGSPVPGQQARDPTLHDIPEEKQVSNPTQPSAALSKADREDDMFLATALKGASKGEDVEIEAPAESGTPAHPASRSGGELNDGAGLTAPDRGRDTDAQEHSASLAASPLGPDQLRMDRASVQEAPVASVQESDLQQEARQGDRDVDPLGGIPVEVRTDADKGFVGGELGSSSVAKEEAESLTDEQPGDEAQEGSSPSLQQPSDRPFLSHLETRPPAGSGEQAESSEDKNSTPRSAGWSERWNVTGSRMQSHWNAFKSKNPNTVQQGMKLAGAVEKFREQAQEQYRRAQEAKRKQHETKGTKPDVDLKGGKSV